MKIKISLIILVTGTFLSACVWLSQNIENTEVITKISARRLGAELQYKEPKIAKEIYGICGFILKGIEKPEVLKQYISELLQQHIEDRLIVEDLVSLIDLIKIKPNIPIDEDQILIINAIVDGLISGIELAGGFYGAK